MIPKSPPWNQEPAREAGPSILHGAQPAGGEPSPGDPVLGVGGSQTGEPGFSSQALSEAFSEQLEERSPW